MFEIIQLNYLENLPQAYEQFLDLPGFVLLQSANLTLGRYDILSAHPYQRVVLEKNNP